MITEHKTLELRDNTNLNLQIMETGAPQWIIVTHGIGEHHERHAYMADLFAHEFNILFYDLRGHGKSEGRRSFVKNFDEFYEDLHEIILFLQSRYKMKRYILFGHSMGALITAGYMQKRVQEDMYPEKVFINAPPVGMPGVLKYFINQTSRRVLEKLAEINISLPIKGLVDKNGLSHDPKVIIEYEQDKLNQMALQTKLLFNLVSESLNVFGRPLRIKCPTYCTYGSEDKVVCPISIKNYFSQVDKSVVLREIPEAYHEIHNEIAKFRKPYFDFLKESLLETY